MGPKCVTSHGHRDILDLIKTICFSNGECVPHYFSSLQRSIIGIHHLANSKNLESCRVKEGQTASDVGPCRLLQSC